MIAALLGLLWLDHRLESTGLAAGGLAAVPVAVLLALLILPAFQEMERMAGQAQVRMLPVSGLVGSLALGMMPILRRMPVFRAAGWSAAGQGDADMLLVLLGLILLAIFLEQMIRGRVDDALRRIACTLLAVAYLGVGAALVLTIRIAHGVPVLLVFLAGVKCTDMGAYFTGKAAGRHKLIPWLSPGKSWEGLVGGLACGAGGALLIQQLCGAGSLGAWQAAVFGASVGLAGQVGDLCESLLKRSAGVKDSGAALPQFGGVLDVLDSILLSAPIGYLLLILLGA